MAILTRIRDWWRGYTDDDLREVPDRSEISNDELVIAYEWLTFRSGRLPSNTWIGDWSNPELYAAAIGAPSCVRSTLRKLEAQ